MPDSLVRGPHAAIAKGDLLLNVLGSGEAGFIGGFEPGLDVLGGGPAEVSVQGHLRRQLIGGVEVPEVVVELLWRHSCDAIVDGGP